MKKFAIAAVTAIVAAASLSGVAEARNRHFFGDDVVSRDVRVIIIKKPRCSRTTIIKRDDFGNKVVKIIKTCG